MPEGHAPVEEAHLRGVEVDGLEASFGQAGARADQRAEVGQGEVEAGLELDLALEVVLPPGARRRAHVPGVPGGGGTGTGSLRFVWEPKQMNTWWPPAVTGTNEEPDTWTKEGQTGNDWEVCAVVQFTGAETPPAVKSVSRLVAA